MVHLSCQGHADGETAVMLPVQHPACIEIEEVVSERNVRMVIGSRPSLDRAC